jgi:DNA-directed RNA polymerase subunit RPC12/RpoP
MSEEQHLHPAEAAGSDDTTIVAAKTATEQPRANPADPDAPRGREPIQEVLTLVCETCGKDYFFEDEAPPEDLKCEKCGGTVFRAFQDSVGDEVMDDFRDSTERDLDPDDPEGDALPGDLMDLHNI